MIVVNFNLTKLYALDRGATWDSVAFLYPQDVSNWSPCGQIRDNYLPSGNLLAQFNFLPLTYGVVDLGNNTTASRTQIIPYLTDEQTSLLPVTRSGNNLVAGLNAWVYDIKLGSPQGKTIIIARGFVQVNPNVSSC